MKPRRAQEDHTHDGIGAIGAGQRGFQIVGSAGDDQWGAGRGALNLRQANVSDDALYQFPDLSTGSALYAFTRARTANSTYGAVLRSYEGGAAQYTVPLHLQGDIRFRWRFGANFDSTDKPWGAVILGPATVSGSSAMTCPTSDANIYTKEWQYAEKCYTVSGGGLSLKPSYTTGFGPVTDSRFVAVGTGAETNDLFMVFKCSLGPDVASSYSVDLGMEYLAGDLVTWDLTYPEGGSTATMKVWHQRLVSDEPTSVEFDVPAAWLPWTEADAANAATYPTSGPDEGKVSIEAPSHFNYRNTVAGTWRSDEGVVSLEYSSLTNTVTYDVSYPSPLVVGDTGHPYYTPIYESVYVGFAGQAQYGPDNGGTGGSYYHSGNVSSAPWSPGTQPTTVPDGFTLVGGKVQNSTAPDAELGRQSTHPILPVSLVLPKVMPASLCDVGMLSQQGVGGLYIEWAGFLMPRPTDEYGLG